MATQKNHPSEKTTVMASGRYRELFSSRSISTRFTALRCVKGPHEGLTVPLEQDIVVIGRAAWCGVSLPEDPQISREHCELLLSEQGIRLRDLKSQNGSFVNDTQVYDAPVFHSFRLGDSVFVLEESQTPKQIDVKHYDKSGLLVGESASMRKIFSMLARLGCSDVSVLLRGETGSGKSSVAKALHEQSDRTDGPFVTVNCGALSPSLIEASLFGYNKGAFTGAEQDHQGFFEQADGGTLFLDEIGELPLDLQPKLLDVLERKKLHRLGSTSEIEVNFRLITATHSPLEELIAEKKFREDLFYRLAVAELDIPPLRERRDDISLIAEYLLHQMGLEQPPTISKQALAKLRRFSWPGNIRQLRNVLERAVVFLDGSCLQEQDFTLPRSFSEASSGVEGAAMPNASFKELLQIEERKILLRFLEAADWNIVAATKHLEMSRASLYERMRKLKIERP